MNIATDNNWSLVRDNRKSCSLDHQKSNYSSKKTETFYCKEDDMNILKWSFCYDPTAIFHRKEDNRIEESSNDGLSIHYTCQKRPFVSGVTMDGATKTPFVTDRLLPMETALHSLGRNKTTATRENIHIRKATSVDADAAASAVVPRWSDDRLAHAVYRRESHSNWSRCLKRRGRNSG